MYWNPSCGKAIDGWHSNRFSSSTSWSGESITSNAAIPFPLGFNGHQRSKLTSRRRLYTVVLVHPAIPIPRAKTQLVMDGGQDPLTAWWRQLRLMSLSGIDVLRTDVPPEASIVTHIPSPNPPGVGSVPFVDVPVVHGRKIAFDADGLPLHVIVPEQSAAARRRWIG